MGRYFARRVLSILPTLFFVTVLIFGLQQLLPGDPAVILAGEDRDPNVVAYLRAKLHLDEPFPVRYAYWLGGVVQGVVLFTATAYITLNLIADMAYFLVNPRMRG